MERAADEEEDFWKSVIRQTLIYQYLEKDIDNIGVLKITEKGKEIPRQAASH